MNKLRKLLNIVIRRLTNWSEKLEYIIMEKHTINFIKDIQLELNLKFNYKLMVSDDREDFWISHNSLKLHNLEEEVGPETKMFLNIFLKHFWNNNIFNIYTDYEPDVFIKVEL